MVSGKERNMSQHTFSNLVFDTETKTFEIKKGSVGVYSYEQGIRKAKVISEDSKFTGKSDMFSHRVAVSKYLQNNPIFTKNTYLGIEIEMMDNQTLYVYISDKANQNNSMPWHEDLEIAGKAVDMIERIQKKYNP